MFCDLSAEALADFDKLGVQMTVPKGAVLFQEDDPGAAVAVICSGQVKLSCNSREGKTMIVKIAMPGDVLGLGAVISGSRYEVTAEALETVSVKSMGREEFLGFLERHGKASMHAARSLSEEYRTAFFDARRLALAPSAAGRLASVLLDWARMHGGNGEELRFTMALTHEELASLAGTSRETVTRLFSRFRREKLIQVKGSAITILKPEQLEAMG
jgi:CRP/FNR family transcriptional regulator